MKYALVIPDGMEDLPQEALGGETPQEAACTPNLDRLEALGSVLRLRNCPEGLPPGSESAIMTILGASPAQCRVGRGALEALGEGIPIGEGFMALRANLIGLSPQGHIRSTAAADGKEALEAMEALMSDPVFAQLLEEGQCTLYPRPSYAQLALLPCRPCAAAEPHQHPGEAMENILPADPLLRRLTLEGSRILKDKGLALWFWGAGPAPEVPAFPLAGGLISATSLCRGIGRAMGLSVPEVPGADGTPDTDYGAKAAAAIALWEQGLPFAAIHIEAPDACSHQRDLRRKVETIERIDRLLLGPVLAYLEGQPEPWRILVLSDHATLCATGQHTAQSVKAWFYDSTGKGPEGNTAFSILTET